MSTYAATLITGQDSRQETCMRHRWLSYLLLPGWLVAASLTACAGNSGTEVDSASGAAPAEGAASRTAIARAVPPRGPLTLETQPDAGMPLARNVPELLARADRDARRWRSDAVAVMVEFEQRDAPNPSMRGPQVRIAYRSPSDGAGQWIYVTPADARRVEVRQRPNWGQLSVPPTFVDLPVAVTKARAHGMQGPVSGALLRIWTPTGQAIAAWMISVKGGRGRTVDATTGAIIDVSGGR